MIGELGAAIRASSLLYDVTQTSYVEWRDIVLDLVMIGAGLLLLLRRDDRRYRMGSAFLIGMGLLFLVLNTGVGVIQHRRLVARLQSGDYEHVEGAITNFSPGSFDGHTAESFTVAGHTYMFHSNVSMAGYHAVQGPDGPLRDGLEVRIADVHGMIARFELIE